MRRVFDGPDPVVPVGAGVGSAVAVAVAVEGWGEETMTVGLLREARGGALRIGEGGCPSLPPMSEPLHVERLVAGGSGLAREAGGRVVLVTGGLPGDTVTVRVTRERRDVVHAEVDEVLVASPHRVAPPCVHLAAGCGGCDLQHAATGAQAALKVDIVRDALRRGAHLDDPPVRAGPVVSPKGYRTTVRCLVVGGRAAWRARASHRPVPVDHCLVAHPLVDEVLAEGRFGDASEVVVRAGAHTGERLVVVSPAARGVSVPSGVVVVGADELAGGRTAAHHEQVAGRRWRISAGSFFQPGAEGADALVSTVAELAGIADRGGIVDRGGIAEGAGMEGAGPFDEAGMADEAGPGGPGPIVDLYGGVGLFSGSLCAAWAQQHRGQAASPPPVILVERSPSATADARHNLADLDATVTVRTLPVERWDPHLDGLGTGLGAGSTGGGEGGVAADSGPGAEGGGVGPAAGGRPASLVVADPPRRGLGRDAVAVVSATGTDRLVLVSCDAAALGRDAGLLADAGFALVESVVVDQFAMTSHVEVVSRFDRLS
jgi:23S rRNA (uracil1939-C5)-methyltransferase